MTKDYTNTREPGEFGDGVTVGLEPEALTGNTRVGVTEAMKIAAVRAYIAMEGKCRPVAMKAALEAALSSGRAQPEAGEVVAWVRQKGGSLYFDNMRLDPTSVPLVRQSALTACQQEVERLRKREAEWASAASYGDGSPMFTPDRLEQSIASMLSRNAELVKALEKISKEVTYTTFGTYPSRGAKIARAALGGQSNE